MAERFIVLRVTGLACHAVEGLGCGSRIAPLFRRIADLAPDAIVLMLIRRRRREKLSQRPDSLMESYRHYLEGPKWPRG